MIIIIMLALIIAVKVFNNIKSAISFESDYEKFLMKITIVIVEN